MDIDKITEAELEILKVLWNADGGVSSIAISDILKEEKSWDKSTVRTLIYRLIEKGVIHQQKNGVYYYSPNITEKEYKDVQTKSFLKRMFKNDAKNLVASLFEQNYISPNEVDDLKRFWNEGGESHS